jgi:drug/metabolite transporter (DMT)-like permease|tara:strand:- start:13142 stop:14116 length:975 start_codon:yes stop_codon:yes gene_type:complete
LSIKNDKKMNVSLFNHPKSDSTLTALILVLIATFVLAFQDSLVKLMSSDTSFWQFQTLRSLGNLSFVLILAMVSGGINLLVPKNWKAVYLRSIFLLLCMFFFFAGAPFLTVAQMAAGLYTYPLFISLLAGPILGEKVGVWRYGALALGAIGSSLVLSPWSNDFSTVQLLPIIAGFFYGANILTIRKACRNESPLALAFAAGLGFLIFGLMGITILSLFPLSSSIRETMPFVAIGWPEITLLIVGFAILSSILNLTGNICISRAYQTADASWLAPMDYSYLIFAAIWSRIIFNQWPSEQALIGMAMIGLAGGVTTWREKVKAEST